MSFDTHEIAWLDSTHVVLTWSYPDGVLIDTYAEVEFEPADRSVGISAGFVVYCNAPRAVEDYLADVAADRAADQYDDSAADRAADHYDD